MLDATTGAPADLNDARIFTAAAQIIAAPANSTVRQTQDDNDWYTCHEKHPVPMLRETYADAQKSWIYLDPATGEVLDIIVVGWRRLKRQVEIA